MQKSKIEITGLIELTYDENSEEFQTTLKEYTEIYDKGAKKEDMLLHVAYNVTRFGTDVMIEGVGYVGYNGRKPTEEPYSGIMVSEDFDEFDFEVIS